MSKRSAGQGGVCGTGSLLLKPFGEFAVRQDSPRPSGTPLINAGGKGLVADSHWCGGFRKLMLRNLPKGTHPGANEPAPKSVILSDRRESKDLRIDFHANVPEVRRSFDSGLRPSLRMTNVGKRPIDWGDTPSVMLTHDSSPCGGAESWPPPRGGCRR